jgi:hypothetical protein
VYLLAPLLEVGYSILQAVLNVFFGAERPEDDFVVYICERLVPIII